MNLPNSNLHLRLFVVFLSCFAYNFSLAESEFSLMDEINKMRLNPQTYYQNNKEFIQANYPAYDEFIKYVEPQKALIASTFLNNYAKDLSDGKKIPEYTSDRGFINYSFLFGVPQSSKRIEYFETIFPYIHSQDIVEFGCYYNRDTNSVYYVFRINTYSIQDMPQIHIDTFQYVLAEELDKYSEYEFLNDEERKGFFYVNLLREHPENFAYRKLTSVKKYLSSKEIYIYSILELKYQSPISPVIPMEELQLAARYNASLMIKDGKLSHFAGGTTMQQRAAKFNCYSSDSENVADLSTKDSLIDAVILFMGSYRHNKNMMNKFNSHMGFAIERDKDNAFSSMNLIRRDISLFDRYFNRSEKNKN